MAIKTDSLTRLIRSMTAVEKAYFKKYGFKKQGTGQQKMLRMFQLCDATKPCATPELEQAFAKAGIENIPLYRNRLFEALVQSLREYQAARTDEEALYHDYRSADILISRGLLKEADPILAKAITKAQQLDLPEHSLLLEHKRHLVLHALGKRKEVTASLKKRLQLANNLTHQIQLATAYEEVYQLQVAEGRKPTPRTRKKLLALAADIEAIDLAHDNFKVRIMAYNVLHSIYFNLGQNAKCLTYSGKIVSLFRINPAFLERRPRPYLQSLFNYLSDCLNNHETTLYLDHVGKIQQLIVEHPELQPEATRMLMVLKTDYLLSRGVSDEVRQFLMEFDAWYRTQSGININSLLDLLARMAFLLYKVGNVVLAQDYLIEFQKQGKASLRPDLELELGILELAIQFEQGNTSLAFYKHKALMQRSRKAILANEGFANYMRCMEAVLKDNRKQPLKTIVQNALKNQPQHTTAEQLVNPMLLLQRALLITQDYM